MSGIFAYAGEGNCRDILLDGISCLEKRGNELSGIAVNCEGQLALFKAACPPTVLTKKAKAFACNGATGIAECSNALRTKPSSVCAVPAANSDFAAALDGYIENFDHLKIRTNAAFPVLSDEDLLLALLSKINCENRLNMIKQLVSELSGNPSFAFMAADENAIYCRAGEAPLLIGISENGFLLSSEAEALLPLAKRYYPLESGESAKITKDRVTVYDSKYRRIKKSPAPLSESDYSNSYLSILETAYGCPFSVKESINRFIQGGSLRFDALRLTKRSTERIHRVVITGSGASYNAARLAADNFERITDIPAVAVPSGELRYSAAILDKGTLLAAVSSDGEDADAAACIKKAKAYGAKTLAFCPSKSSCLARLCAGTVQTAGTPVENGNFISACLALSFFTLYVGYKNDIVSDVYLGVSLKVAEMLTGKVSTAVKATPALEGAAKRIANSKTLFVTGLGTDFAVSLEAARQLRSEAKINACAYPASELASEAKELLSHKLVAAVITNRELLQNSLRYIRRIKSLGAEVIILTTSDIESEINDFESVISFPDSVALFNPVVCISGIYKISKTVKELLSEENEQQAG